MTTKFNNLHEATQDFIKHFARDHFIKLSGTDKETVTREERDVSVGYFGQDGGWDSVRVDVQRVTFTPDHFSFGYKGATISGSLNGVTAEVEVSENGRSWNCEQDGIVDAVEEACGFPFDESEIEEPEMDF